ncbi:MAG: hypothetical protein HN742_14425 [Lentisphaerae bacterium]|jgi:uncharacterized protein YdeI (YjbR/CyaY-like superfamily)|nr:hypothetical protein [Lentisphaerota bacterium]MBT4820975.1 hypothetical protein [Lentisphaerota bacterium]MBT5606852.1 hypothetical protein [Lentisphaerota bacterium]MBT7055290.1 hypothetical protein [Lentisphaerota bacterium]MBT7843071.1 hypothetical protein [Lentisphaerota bacterium]
MNELRVNTRKQWREWLVDNHARKKGVWLVFHKKHTGIEDVPYEETVEEALCFGWIDSIIKRLDDDRYARKYTPRNSGSNWSKLNKDRVEKMLKAGLVTDDGLRLINEAKASGEWEQQRGRPQLPPPVMPEELRDALAENPHAKEYFLALAPSYRKDYVLWVGMAKRAETRQRRAREAIGKLSRGERLGLK